MYRSEQVKNELNSFKKEIATKVFGIPHVGSKSRFWSNLKASKRLLEADKLDILEVGSGLGALVFWLAQKYPRHHIS